jgi:hypothetical protein
MATRTETLASLAIAATACARLDVFSSRAAAQSWGTSNSAAKAFASASICRVISSPKENAKSVWQKTVPCCHGRMM